MIKLVLSDLDSTLLWQLFPISPMRPAIYSSSS